MQPCAAAAASSGHPVGQPSLLLPPLLPQPLLRPLLLLLLLLRMTALLRL
jgi:hypothetical protein